MWVAHCSKPASAVWPRSVWPARTAASTRSGTDSSAMTGWPVCDPAASASSRARASAGRPETRSSRASAQVALAAWSRRPRGTACSRASAACDRQASSRPCMAASSARVPRFRQTLLSCPVSLARRSPSDGACRGGGVAAGGHLRDGEGLQEIREQDELAGWRGPVRPPERRSRGWPCRRRGSERPRRQSRAGWGRRMVWASTMASRSNGAPRGGIALQDAADPHEQAERELVDALLVVGAGRPRAAPPRSSGRHPRHSMPPRSPAAASASALTGSTVATSAEPAARIVNASAGMPRRSLDHTAEVRDVRPQAWLRTTGSAARSSSPSARSGCPASQAASAASRPAGGCPAPRRG